MFTSLRRAHLCHICKNKYVVFTYVLKYTTVAPGFGDSVKELRATHSGLFTELQHCFCEVANENTRLHNELQSLQEEAGNMQSDIITMQDTMQALNSVSNKIN